MDKRRWAWFLLCVAMLAGLGGAASAERNRAGGAGSAGLGGQEHPAATSPAALLGNTVLARDDVDALPFPLQGQAMSSLIRQERIQPAVAPRGFPGPPASRQVVAGGITWGPARNMSMFPGATEPAAALHPTDPLRLLSGGNKAYPLNGIMIVASTDGGSTWQQSFPQPAGTADGVMAWLPLTVNGGLSALYTYLATAGVNTLFLDKTTDGGVTWAAVPNSTIHVAGWSDDRPYLWTDHNPASPYYGRVYLTQTLFGSGGSLYDGISVRWSTDEGVTWSPHTALVDAGEAQRYENFNQFASLAIQPDGAVVAGWRRGKCCGSAPQINVPNKYLWSRSTDGGTTFAISGTVATVPVAQSISLNSHTPGNFAWSDAPNLTADPVDGTLYMVWVDLRQPDLATSAAVYLARGTPDGSQWTVPVVVDNSHPDRYQFMPWVQVSADHTVHITYSAAVDSDVSLAHFYVQSTDEGATFSPPFMLSDAQYPAATFMGDYQAASIGAGAGGRAAILTTWTANFSGTDHWGRVGTFPLGMASPTPTAPAPTSTPTAPPSSTPPPVATLTATPSPAPPTASPPPTVSPPPAATHTPGATFTQTPTRTPTITPLPTQTPGGLSPTPCTIRFSDVHETDYFYTPVLYLACHGVISGYADGTFRPYNNTTRSQMVKIVVLGFQLAIVTPAGGNYTFADVVPTFPFFAVVETAAADQIVSGYACGGAGEPCDSQHRPYFRSYANVTRGQLSKIAVVAAGWPLQDPATGTFADVAPGSAFYPFVETAVCHGVVSGYACGGAGEPCDAQHRPYFRSYNPATRGQIAKIVDLALTAGGACSP